MLLIGSSRKGGYGNVALFSLADRQVRWVTDTQWSATPLDFSRDGKTLTYLLNADGRLSAMFVDVRSLQASTRGVPDGLNFGGGSPTSFLPDGRFLVAHQKSTHPAELYRLRPDAHLQQITRDESQALERAVLPASQLVTYRSFDGKLISALV